MHVAVNLSAKQLEQPDLRDIVLRALAYSGLPPSALVLEITRKRADGPRRGSIDLMRDLRSLGIHLSIDDFGHGYSSLYYLKHLPANTLKSTAPHPGHHEDEDAWPSSPASSPSPTACA